MAAPIEILVDADACPVKAEIYRVAARHKVRVTVVSGSVIAIPPDPMIERVIAGDGFDAADDRIAERARPGSIVVTADVPLAAAVVKKGGLALNPRGELYTAENIGEHLSRRDLLDELRGLGLAGGGPPPFGDADKRAFAGKLDTVLTRALRGDRA